MSDIAGSERTRIDRAYFEQSKKQFESLIGHLKWLGSNSQGQEAYSQALRIKDFLTARFEYELQVMVHNCHPDAVIHHQQHQLLLEKLLWMIFLSRERRGIPPYVFEFLGDWLEFHQETLDYSLCGLKAPISEKQSAWPAKAIG